MDTVDVTEGWTRDPFSAEIEERKLYGLGSSDMKGGLAALIWAFKKAVKEKLLVNLLFTAVVDEEINSQGAFELLKEIGGDLAIIAEPTDEKIMLGARGRFALDLIFRGKSAHGARPYKGANAIICASEFLSKLGEIPLRTHEKMGMGSITPLKITGGDDFLSIPDICTVVVDRHIVPGERREDVMEEFRKLLESVETGCDAEIRWHPRPTPFLEAYEFSPETEFIRDFVSFYREKYGLFEPIYGESVGDYNLFAKSMPTVVYGPKGGNWHSADEYVHTDSVEAVAKTYYEFLKRMGERYEGKNA